MVGLKDIFAFIEALVWPAVVAGALIGFRKPLSNFLKEIAQRATKLSITSIFALELPLPEAPTSESDPFVSILPIFASGGDAIISDVAVLLNKIAGEKALDYLIVDLGTGHKWLTSRLFIFAIMLQRMRDLRCLVFLETRGDVDRRFVGTASPTEIHVALAQRYPWLEETYLKARTQQEKFPLQARQGKLDTQEATQIIMAFLSQNRRFDTDKDHPPDPENERSWEFLESRQDQATVQYWEHANWIDRKGLESDLGDALQKDDSACFEDSPDISQVNRRKAIVRRKGSFVALVDKERVFKSLIDRKALLDQVAERIGAASDKQ